MMHSLWICDGHGNRNAYLEKKIIVIPDELVRCTVAKLCIVKCTTVY